ncbi:NAD(P)H-dependent oxidoreductase [Sphingomonas sp. BN140010]|uniref:NAD(P)H-dependent oxidoreductase n=1 Tax=Sphingomonas arvum TaxID=2992113 RepID=A0ABT3JCJ4_9SPHN|nr:NAD(P)H-dependent oxidoreductase [Sphingomonas sp. BN140010]MCW3796756.1 NAD(P)H-dependent oxidoreductase [Sphingomonas sp. BN140010]
MPQDQHRIAIIVGSIREGSLSRKLARAIRGAVPQSLDCGTVEIADLPLYDPDLDHEPPAPWTRFRQEIGRADGVLFVTPEYNRSIPAALKNAIDVGSRPYGKSAFAKKPAAIVTMSPGALGGFGCNHHLRQCCVFLDMPVMQQPEAYIGHVSDEKFAADGSIADASLAKLMGSLGQAFAGWVDLIKAGRAALAPDPAGAGA